jgi:hypothetical protein
VNIYEYACESNYRNCVLEKRNLLSEWKEKFKDDVDAMARIEKCEKSYRYAEAIIEFYETLEISLENFENRCSGICGTTDVYILRCGVTIGMCRS